MQVGCDRFEIEVIELRENSKHSRDTKREERERDLDQSMLLLTRVIVDS